jgi:hypothetical protein
MNTVFHDTTLKAAKPHRCWFCNERIEIGDTYDKRTGADNDGLWTMKMHPECNAYASEHWDEFDYEGHERGEFTRPMTAFDPVI